MRIKRVVSISLSQRELVEIIKKKLYKEQGISTSDVSFRIENNKEGKPELVEMILQGEFRNRKEDEETTETTSTPKTTKTPNQ